MLVGGECWHLKISLYRKGREEFEDEFTQQESKQKP